MRTMRSHIHNSVDKNYTKKSKNVTYVCILK